MNALEILLWVVVPYVSLAIFVVGHYWRYKYDKFGWTTRSSQLYERRLLRWGSPLFHFGILFVALGHVGGLGIPKSWTSAVGISEEAYHVVALATGAIAGFCTLAGLAILIYRRRTVGPVFSATTKNDKFMYVVLTLTILFGLSNTVLGALGQEGVDYRDTVSPWFRIDLLLPAAARAHGRGGAGLPAARPVGAAAVRDLAVHPAGARVQCADRLLHPALHRLPQPRRPARQPGDTPGLGPGRRWPPLSGGTLVREAVTSGRGHPVITARTNVMTQGDR